MRCRRDGLSAAWQLAEVAGCSISGTLKAWGIRTKSPNIYTGLSAIFSSFPAIPMREQGGVELCISFVTLHRNCMCVCTWVPIARKAAAAWKGGGR
jgi:hypothetical protein